MTTRVYASVIALALAASCSRVPQPRIVPAHCETAPIAGVPSVASVAALRLQSGARVVMVSFDGLGADPVQEFRTTQFGDDGFNRILREGTSIRRVVPVNPTLTSVTHTSLATGAKPDVTGIASNTFHIRGTPAPESASGFEQAIGADTIWEAARRAGKTVGVLTFPGVDGSTPRRTADWGLIYTHTIVKPRVIRLERKDFSPDWMPPGWEGASNGDSFSPKLTARVQWEAPVATVKAMDVLVTALDTTDDKVANYDAINVRFANESVRPDAKRWFPVWRDIPADGAVYRYGSWSKVLGYDPHLQHVTLYWGGIHRIEGYPESFRKMVETRVGFWPGPPDDNHMVDWDSDNDDGGAGVDPETFREQMVRFSTFFTDATILAMKSMPFDLILSYQPIVDETEHRFLITNPRQQGYDPAKAQGARVIRAAAYAQFDDAVERILRELDPGSALVITGDHGLGALDTQVRVNRLLVEWGYAKTSGDGRSIDPSSPWAAYATGSVAHIYSLDPSRLPEASVIAQKLRDLRDPDGAPVFELVTFRNAQSHSNAGDIIAYSYPRIALSSSVSSPAFEKSTYFGQHGGLNHHCELHTIFAAYGKGVPKQQLGAAEQTKLIRLVSTLLGISPPRNAE
jgi:hypothetical protein